MTAPSVGEQRDDLDVEVGAARRCRASRSTSRTVHRAALLAHASRPSAAPRAGTRPRGRGTGAPTSCGVSAKSVRGAVVGERDRARRRSSDDLRPSARARSAGAVEPRALGRRTRPRRAARRSCSPFRALPRAALRARRRAASRSSGVNRCACVSSISALPRKRMPSSFSAKWKRLRMRACVSALKYISVLRHDEQVDRARSGRPARDRGARRSPSGAGPCGTGSDPPTCVEVLVEQLGRDALARRVREYVAEPRLARAPPRRRRWRRSSPAPRTRRRRASRRAPSRACTASSPEAQPALQTRIGCARRRLPRAALRDDVARRASHAVGVAEERRDVDEDRVEELR